MSQGTGTQKGSGDSRSSGPDEQAEGEDDESSSSSSSSESELEEFRRQWKQEVSAAAKVSEESPVAASPPADVEADALRLFMEGVEHEENGELFEAILKYRRAVHLMPDIERKAFDAITSQRVARSKPKRRAEVEHHERHPVDDDDEKRDLVGHFSKAATQEAICEPEVETKVAHISCLPMEVLINIIKWVVSSELDLRSLENVSEVCRGFYLAARSSDVWRLICIQTWGSKVAPPMVGDWRSAFLSRPRVGLNGCYIARMTYMREGERGLTDHQFYRAWHVVQYFRLIRFFPGGKVVMNTTAEEPSQAVKMFANGDGYGNPGCLVGVYQLAKNRVVCVAQKETYSRGNTKPFKRYRRNNNAYHFEVPEQVFHFELEIKGRKCKHLNWVSYAVVSRYRSSGKEQTTEFDVTNANNYPPLRFSHVRSFRSNTSAFPLGC